MARKVFISFLGGTDYGACHYATDTYKSAPVRYIQEAMLDMLTKTGEWTSDDIAYILLTKGAKKLNWHDDGHRDRNTGEVKKQPGLQTQLKNLNPAMPVETICNLPDGNNEQEILEIFQRVYEKIQEGDELYFDVTHGFRYLPMLSIVLGNYAKTLKNVTIKSISYGNFEARDKETNTAQIVDLIALSALQDWSAASASFVKHGNADDLTKLGSESLKPILKEAKGKNPDATALRSVINTLQQVVDDFRTCRGINIVKSSSFDNLKKQLDNIDTVVVPLLVPILDKIGDVFKEFDARKTFLNGFNAADWCMEHGLFQQAITIFFENVVTYFCFRHNLNWETEKQRSLVNMAFNCSMNNTPENEWRFISNEEDNEKNRNVVRSIIQSDEMKHCLPVFIKLRDMRNDFNHSGMRNNPMSPSKLKSGLSTAMNQIKEILCS